MYQKKEAGRKEGRKKMMKCVSGGERGIGGRSIGRCFTCFLYAPIFELFLLRAVELQTTCRLMRARESSKTGHLDDDVPLLSRRQHIAWLVTFLGGAEQGPDQACVCLRL